MGKLQCKKNAVAVFREFVCMATNDHHVLRVSLYKYQRLTMEALDTQILMKFGQVTYFGEKQKYLVSILWSGRHCCHGSEGPFSASFQQNCF